MRFVLAAILSVSLLSTLCIAAEKPALKDTKDKESYSLGYQFGQSMKAQGMDIDLGIYASGIHDALSGATPQLSPDEIRTSVMDLQKRLAAARQKEIKEMADKNLAEGKVFLEENTKKKA